MNGEAPGPGTEQRSRAAGVVDLATGILGPGLVALGGWMIYPPAGVILAGLALLAFNLVRP